MNVSMETHKALEARVEKLEEENRLIKILLRNILKHSDLTLDSITLIFESYETFNKLNGK